MEEIKTDVPVYIPFDPGTKIKVNEAHPLPNFRGDVGEIVKFLPIDKYWVQLKRNGKCVVHMRNLEKLEKDA